MANPSRSSYEARFIFEAGDTPMCHAPTIAETPTGLVAAWFGGTREGSADCSIYQSVYLDGWQMPVRVCDAQDEGGPCWNPVLLFCDGKLWMWYKVGEKPWSWECRLKIDDGESMLDCLWPKHILGPDKNPPLIGVASLTWGSSVETGGPRSRSRSWLPRIEGCDLEMKHFWIESIDGVDAIQPTIFSSADTNRLDFLLCRTRQGFLAKSMHVDGPHNYWSDLTATDLGNPDSAVSGVTLKDGRNLLVHNPSSVIAQRTPLLVSIQRQSWKDFEPVFVLEDGEGRFSYPTVIEASDGRIHIVYSWNRERIKHVVIEPQELK